MIPRLKKVANRLSRTGWDELQTRLSQALTKRTDYALYRAGRLAEPELDSGSSHESKFFFQPDELASRAALIKQHLPSAVEDTIDEANEILQHRFRLLGYRDIVWHGRHGRDDNTDIDWHLDAVHGKRAPLKPWYKIQFLDFHEVGDHKVTWELNRHQHFVILAKAWAFTGDERYTQEIARQFYSWQKANPYPIGINWGSSLEVAFRSLSWLWIRNLLKRASGLPESLGQDLKRALTRHGKYIETFLSTYFSPNTHLIGEAVALFFIGTLCPEIPLARRWQQKGLRIVLAEAERQVRPDGVYFEQSLYYHVYALDFFLHTRALAACNHLAVPESFDATLRRMLEVVRILSSNGPLEGFGDDDGGRVFNPRRNHVEHMSDPLALGAAIFQEPALRGATAITEEAIWLFGQAAVMNPAEESPQPISVAFPDGGLYSMASDRAHMLIDSGPHGAGSCGHGHADALSIQLSFNGRRWLVDPGSYLYIAPESEPKARDQFRGTAAHNTLRIDGVDQANTRGPFSWASLPDVRAYEWKTTPQFDFFDGGHTGYMRLPEGVLHHRGVFHVRGEYWLVLDAAGGSGVHDMELFWHFAPELQLSALENGVTANAPDGSSLTLSSAAASPWTAATEQGYVSAAYGEKQPAPVGIFRKSRTPIPLKHATLLSPSRYGEEPGTFRFLGETDVANAYSYQRGDIIDTFVFGGQSPVWQFGPFRSHAMFFFARARAGELEHVILKRAAFAEWNGQPFYQAQDSIRILWVHWTKADGVATSHPELLKFFDPEVLRVKTAVPLKQ